MKALWAAALLSLAARAWGQSTAAISGEPAGSWTKQGASLLFHDSSGTLSSETGLGSWEDSSGSRASVHEIRAGTSKDGRFAWTLDRVTLWNPLRTRELESRRLLRFFGASGAELWENEDADAPDSGEPVVFSDDGETLILALRTDSGWSASVRSYIGSVLVEAGPFPRLQMITLTPNGRYALARWLVPDQSATHTFLNVPAKTRKDIPSGELILGLARMTDEGKVYSGHRLVYDLASAGPKP